MPTIYIIAGCNGAGKTTASFTVLPESLNVLEFVNADEIARGLSPFQPENVAIQAGRIMVARLNELLENRKDFAFETTLASRSYANLIKRARELNYEIHLIYYWLQSTELAITRVMARVKEGGHNIPEETIVRRYYAGIRNFFNIYSQLVDTWLLIDNSNTEQELIAENQGKTELKIYVNSKWEELCKLALK